MYHEKYKRFDASQKVSDFLKVHNALLRVNGSINSAGSSV